MRVRSATPHKPHGHKPDATKAVERRVASLVLENEKLRKKLGLTEQIIDKKLCQLWANGYASAVISAAAGLVALPRASHYRAHRHIRYRTLSAADSERARMPRRVRRAAFDRVCRQRQA